MFKIEGLTNGSEVLFSEMQEGVNYLGDLAVAQDNEPVVISRAGDVITIHFLEEEEGQFYLKEVSEFEASTIIAKVGDSLLQISNEWKQHSSEQEYNEAMELIKKMDSCTVSEIPNIIVTLFEEVFVDEVPLEDENKAYLVK